MTNSKSNYINKEEISVGSTLKVHNHKNNQDSFYRMSSDFQVTLEYCNGISASNYINIVTLSPSDTSFSSFDVKTYLSYVNLRALHHHDYYEFLFVLEGEVIHKIEDKEYHYRAGTCCLINRTINHGEVFIGQCKLLFIGLSAKLISELFTEPLIPSDLFADSEIIDNTLFHFFTADIQQYGKKEYIDFFPVFQNSENEKILHTISDRLLSELMLPHFGSTYACMGLICSFIEHLSYKKNFHISHIELNSSPDYLLFSRINHMFEDTNGRISRNELAKIFNYSGNYINKVVKKYSGICLYDYGMTFCMSAAKKMLTETDASISQIMESLEFTNTTHFYELFKKQYGSTPGEYRKFSQKKSSAKK